MYYGPYRGFGCLFLVACIVLLFYPFWKIVTKAGYPGAMSLLFFVPIVNFILSGSRQRPNGRSRRSCAK